jgi:hypothetical protein
MLVSRLKAEFISLHSARATGQLLRYKHDVRFLTVT